MKVKLIVETLYEGKGLECEGDVAKSYESKEEGVSGEHDFAGEVNY
jgi:hypothetical protein